SYLPGKKEEVREIVCASGMESFACKLWRTLTNGSRSDVTGRAMGRRVASATETVHGEKLAFHTFSITCSCGVCRGGRRGMVVPDRGLGGRGATIGEFPQGDVQQHDGDAPGVDGSTGATGSAAGNGAVYGEARGQYSAGGAAVFEEHFLPDF